MSIITIIMVIFSMLAALDRIFGNKLGLGKEFEKGFMLLGAMSLSMIGMIIISPFISELIKPMLKSIYNLVGIDPSLVPALLFANDMGGAPLAKELAVNKDIGMYNALVVSSMFGATISFTIPFALNCVKKEQHEPMLLGFLCGMATIPVGCFVVGLFSNIPFLLLVINLLPMIIFTAILAVGLLKFPKTCIKIFGILGAFIKIVITVGLALGILKFLTGIEILKGLETIENGAAICLNASIVMSGAFPLIFVISKILSRPVKSLGKLLNINETSAIGFISTLATNATTLQMMNDMDYKGTVLNASFAVSAAFTFAGHLAFTMAFDASYLSKVIIAKLISGFCAIFFALLVYKIQQKSKTALKT